MDEAIRQAKHLEAPNQHMLNPTRCFGCDRMFDSGESGGYAGLVSCFCGICLMKATREAESKTK